MIQQKLSDEEFGKLTSLVLEYNNKISNHFLSYTCPSQVSIIRIFHEMFEKVITKQKVKQLTERPLKNKIFNTYHNRLLFLLMLEACTRGYPITDYIFCIGMINYNLLLKKYLPYCDPEIFSRALTFLRSVHFFNKTSSPQQMIRLLSVNLERKYYQPKVCNIESIEVILIHIRTRIARSLKSFVTAYYKAKEKHKVQTFNENIEEVSNSIATKITTTGFITKLEHCQDKYNMLEKIKNLPYDAIYSAIFEALSIIGTRPSKKKILTNINKLEGLKQICKEINLPVTPENIVCVFWTMLASGGINV